MSPLHEPIDPRPFLAWCDQRLGELTDRPGDPIVAPGAVLMSEIGRLPADAGLRRLRRWRTELSAGAVERALIEDALHHAGVGWWEIYPPEDPGEERWCRRCDDMVATITNRCCWCGSFTASQPAEAVPA